MIYVTSGGSAYPLEGRTVVSGGMGRELKWYDSFVFGGRPHMVGDPRGVVMTSSGGAVVGRYSVLSGATVKDIRRAYVYSGGTATGCLFSGNAVAYVSSGGLLSDTAFDRTAFYCASGGVAAGCSVAAGGVVVSSGGLVRDAVCDSLTQVSTRSGGVIAGADTVIYNLNGYANADPAPGALNGVGVTRSAAHLDIGDGIRLVSAQVSDVGRLTLWSGASATSTTIFSSGLFGHAMEFVCSGAVASRTVVSGGFGTQFVSGGTAVQTSVYGAGALSATAGASVLHPYLSGLSSVLSAGDGAVVSGATIISAAAYAAQGATLSSPLVSQAGSARIGGGGTVVSGRVAGGQMSVAPGGAAADVNISSGGRVTVSSSAVADGCRVWAGGTLFVLSAGTATRIQLAGGTVVSSAGAYVTYA